MSQLTPEQQKLIEYLKANEVNTVAHTLGIRVESYHPDNAVVALDVDSRLFQPAGVVHGGVYVLLSESAASIAGSLSVDVEKEVVFGMEINANHLRPVTEGTLRATTTPLHRGRTTQVYEIKVTDDKERLISVSRCTLAVRPR